MIEAKRMRTEDSARQKSNRSTVVVKQSQLKGGEKYSPTVKPHNQTEFRKFMQDLNTRSHRNLKHSSTNYDDSYRDTNFTLESCYPTTSMSRNKKTIVLNDTLSSKDKVLIFRNDEERSQSIRQINLIRSG